MSQNALSAHGTLIARQTAGAGQFNTIGELRDITPPPKTKNSIELTSHNDDDDFYTPGVRRKGEMTFQIGFIPSDGTHDHITGLRKSWYDGSIDVWRITYPDDSTDMFSGFITNMGEAAPMDDGLTAEVSVQPTGVYSFT